MSHDDCDPRSRRHRRPDGAASGFTLVEVMVALTLLSLVMLATVTALRTLGNTGVAIDRVTTRVDEVRAVSTLLRGLLESTLAGSDTGGLTLGGGTSEITYFLQGDGFFELDAAISFGEGFGGSYRVRVAREDTSLVLRWQEIPAPGMAVDWAGAPSRVLLPALETFDVTSRPDFVNPWQAEWVEPGMPALLRLHVVAAGRYWPDLIIRVRG